MLLMTKTHYYLFPFVSSRQGFLFHRPFVLELNSSCFYSLCLLDEAGWAHIKLLQGHTLDWLSDLP